MALPNNPTLEEIIDEAERLNNLIVDRGGAKTITPKTTNQVLAKGNYKGDITIKGDANLVASNIVKGKSIFGVAGTATMENHTNLPPWLSKITDIYIPATNMPSARTHLTSTAVGTNIFVLDGVTSPGTMNLCYDTVRNTWATKANAPIKSWYATVVTVGTNIYRIGGDAYPYTRNDCYDTTNNTWSTKASMPTPRWEVALSAVGTNIYAIGGTDNNNSGTKLNKNECYNTKTNTWSTKAVLPTPRYKAYSEPVGTNIYVIGGSSGNNNYTKNECYSTTSNTWTTKADMPTPSYRGASSVVGDNIYVFGGTNYSVSPSVELNKNQCYNTKTNTWSTKRNMSIKRYEMTASAVGNSVYIIGGYIKEETYFETSRNDCYII